MLQQTAAPSAETLSVSSAKHRRDPAASVGPFSKSFLCFAANHSVLVSPGDVKANVEVSGTAIDEHLVVEAAMINAAIDAAPKVPKQGAVSAKLTDNVIPKRAKLEMASNPAPGPLSNSRNGRSFFKTFVTVYCFLLFTCVAANSGDQSSKNPVTPVGPEVRHLVLSRNQHLRR